jgi:hypothetical protein
MVCDTARSLADLRHRHQLAAQLAVTALTHHADLFVAFSN